MRFAGNAISWALVGALVWAGGFAQAEDAPAPSDPKFFEATVYPIFQSRCVSCHGPEKQKAKLRLDTAEGINAGSEDGPIFVASKSAESQIIKLISKPAGDDEIMPPKGDPLTAEQIATIAAWIDAGASLGEFKGGGPKEQNANAAAADSAVSMAAPSEVKPYDGGVLATLAKNVQPAAPEAVKALSDAGALALNVDRSSPLLSVNFQLAGAQVGDDKLAALAQTAPQVTWLNLANTKVSDAGLAALAGLPNLTILHLERTGIGDAGLDAIAGLQYLEYLNVYGTQVSDAGLAKLASIKSLKKLYVWQSKVTPAGVDAIKAAIPGIYVNNGIELAAAAEAAPAPAAEPTPAPAPDPAPVPATPALDLSLLFDKDSCCAKANAEGKECDHPCCAEARAAGKVCEKCNALGAKKLAALEKATGDSCCAKAKAEGKLCEHPCCKEALEKGELCTKCNPEAAPAPAPVLAPAPEAAPAAALDLALLFDKDACCARAKADGKDCEHPCCAEARAAGKVCEKCNPLGAKKLPALEKATGDTCCAKAKAKGKLCEHPCCKEALEKGELCTKCNPQAAPVALELQYDENSCCAVAKAAGKECDHPCCVEARKAGKACEKCNPKSAAKKDLA